MDCGEQGGAGKHAYYRSPTGPEAAVSKGSKEELLTERSDDPDQQDSQRQSSRPPEHPQKLGELLLVTPLDQARERRVPHGQGRDPFEPNVEWDNRPGRKEADGSLRAAVPQRETQRDRPLVVENEDGI